MNRIVLLRTTVYEPVKNPGVTIDRDREYIGYSVLLDGNDIGYVYRLREHGSTWGCRGPYGVRGGHPTRRAAVDTLVAFRRAQP